MTDLLQFVTGPLPGPLLPVRYEAWLVVVSYLVAALASYTAIELVARVREFHADARKATGWLTGSAVTMGAGIWSMHFLAMLALQLPVLVRYELWTTLTSMAIAMVTSGLALSIVTHSAATAARLALGGAVMGLGISAMHYTGMAAMRLEAQVMYYPGPFILSVAAAIACATLALWLLSRHGDTDLRSRLWAAAIMGVAVSAMHYTGMYATVCVATGATTALAAGLDPLLLALAVTSVTLLTTGVALTLSLHSQREMQALRGQNLSLRAEIGQMQRVEAALHDQQDSLQAVADKRSRDLSQASRDLQESEARFRATFDQAAVGIAHFDLDHRRTRVNRRYCEIVGYEEQELLGRPPGFLSHPDERGLGSSQRAQLLSGAINHYSQDKHYLRKDGTDIWVRRTESLARDSAGTPLYYIRVIEDITARKRAEAWSDLQKMLLEKIAAGVPLRESLTLLARALETHLDGILCSILLLDKDGLHLTHGAAPSLPEAYCRMVEGLAIGPAAGSCGTAVYRKEAVFVDDIASDPLWAEYRAAALPHGLRACWSTPIFGAQREVLGTFALYDRKPSRPSPLHLQLIQIATDIAALAIGKQRADEALNMMRFGMDHAGDSVFWVNREGRIVYANDAACAGRGYTRKELLAMTVLDLNPDYQADDWDLHFDNVKRHGILTFEARHRAKDGRMFPVEITANYVQIDGQDINFATVRDITERKQAAQMQAQLAAIVQTSNDAIIARAPDDTIVSWNAAAERMFGWRADEALGMPFRRLLSMAPEGIRQQHFERIQRGEPTPLLLEQIRKRKDGSTLHVETTMSAVRDEQGKVLFVSCIMRDITEKIKAERHIEQLATIDGLTGLANRSMLLEQMNTAIARAQRTTTQMAVMFVDLDRFKEVNDTLGHDAGDELLRECAKRLSACVREPDFVARLGGDEFVVLLADISDTATVSPIADRMLGLLTAPYQLRGMETKVSASIGICFYPADGQDVTTLMKNADIAMYHAKELGRNNYQYFAEEMNQRMMQRLQLESELRAAVENGEFILHYQPQVNIATGEIQGTESLIRWNHPTRGLLSPADFIALAEETGLIVPIGEWLLDHACAAIKSWHDTGVGIPYIVVNVSAAQLGEELVSSVRQALVKHGIEAGWLMLEITETMLMARVDEAISILRRIRDLGIRIAMDDFGTGYSSLSVLQRVPLDMLKIDRSFVTAIDDEANNARAVAIIGAIIAIAKELNLSVVAEGVETPTQLAFLRTLDCDAYQGYIYGMPVDTVSLERRFAGPVKSVLLDDQGRPITLTTKVTLELPVVSR